jgi:Zn-dependent peptidase ImmA (M78 family)
MVTWADAHRLAISLSARVLRRHPSGIDQPVPLSEIAEAEGIVVRYAPIPTLAGAYVAGDEHAPPGIMINTRLPWSKQRYTLAHELGHHYFEHGSQADADTDLLTTSNAGDTTSDYERLAEAFAAWMLMPRRQVNAALGRLGNASTLSPVDVYRLSLLLGASYRATCVHLSNLRRLRWPDVEAFLKVQPKTIKRELIGPLPVTVGTGDVHIVTPDINQRHDVRSGDLLIFNRSAPTGNLPELLKATPGSRPDNQVCVVVQPGDVVNPVRPSSRLIVETHYGPIDVVVHHELNGVSESWFK